MQDFVISEAKLKIYVLVYICIKKIFTLNYGKLYVQSEEEGLGVKGGKRDLKFTSVRSNYNYYNLNNLHQ